MPLEIAECVWRTNKTETLCVRRNAFCVENIFYSIMALIITSKESGFWYNFLFNAKGDQNALTFPEQTLQEILPDYH
jgi:hypothetical protein